jgi:hypothetical protein
LEKFKPHILVITETKLINSDKITFRNYTLTRQDRNNNKNTRGGGVLIAVRKGVPYTSKKTPNTSLETAAIQLADNGPAIVGAYNPPYNYFKVSELSKILAISNKTILAGDLNAKNTVWNCNSNETNGITLEKYLNSSGTSINFPNEPTHTPLNGTNPTTIDIFLAKNIQNYTRARTLNDLNSDHSPVCMETTYDGLEDVSRRITSFKNTDWTKFRSDINRAIKINSNIGTIEKLNSEITKFTSILVEMSKKHSKEVDPTFRLQIPDDITQLMKERNKIRKIYQRTGASEDKNLMTKHNEEIKNRLEIHKRKFWNNKLKKLNTKDNSLWKMAKSLKKNRNELPPLQLVNGDEAVTDKEKAEALVSHFQSIHQDLFSISTPEQDRIDTEVEAMLKTESPPDNDYLDSMRTNPHEIFKIVKRLKIGKAFGEDNVQNIVLKNLPRKAIIQLNHIVNAIFNLNYFPVKFKSAVIIPIPKSGKNKMKISSYRPISLLSSTAKVVEKIIQIRLNKIIVKHRLDKPTQMGFKKNHSTTLQLARIINEILIEFNKDKTTAMTLIDLEKAFDTVWINGLVKKMCVNGININFAKLIHSYLAQRDIKVKVNNTLSTTKTINRGVPQGSVIAPTLFNLFTFDIPDFEKSKTALYADDMATYAHSFYAQAAITQNQIHVRKLENYYKSWKLKINESKTENIIFARKRTNINILSKLRVGDHQITPSKSVKYLGLQLDPRLNFKKHIHSSINKGNAALRTLYPLLAKNSGLGQENKVLIYKQIIRPIITYGAPIWSHISNYALNPIEIFQNKCLRLAANASRFTRIRDLYHFTGVGSIREFTTNLAEAFFNRHYNNPLITDILKKNARHKHKLLHTHLDL